MLHKHLLRLVLIGLVITLAAQSVLAQEATATTSAVLNVRSGPGRGNPALTVFPRNTPVILEGRNNAGDWALVHNADGSIRGWVAVAYLNLGPGVNLMALPVTEEQIPVPANPAANSGSANPPPAGSEPTGTTRAELNVRTGPGRLNAVITKLPPNTQVIIEGRNAIGDWVLVHTPDNVARGWVASRYLALARGVILVRLPVATETLGAAPGSNPAAASPPGSAAPSSGWVYASEGDMIRRLESAPVLYNFATSQVQQIRATGRRRGNNPNVFTKMGDSVTANLPFMTGFGQGGYNLGPYGYLQGTINFFSAPPRAGVANSFVNPSLTAKTGFNSSLFLDPTWADPALCSPGENLLLCEFRLVKPSVIIILLGPVDSQVLSLEQYTAAMQVIVQTSINRGVIPVLTTFPVSHSYLYYTRSLQFNMVLLDLAERYGIPVINLWRATVGLPAQGLDTDLVHLSQGGNPYSFAFSEEYSYGTTRRNLITLQALDELARNVLSR